jgi:V/A-type H+-transporting ATPase subunit D
MALKFQYNKTYLQQLNRELKVRENALPTLMAKESALRLEVKKARQEAAAIEAQMAEKRAAVAASHRLWSEFRPQLVRIADVTLTGHKIAGVNIPSLDSIRFEVATYGLSAAPPWLPRGIELLKEVAVLGIRQEIAQLKVSTLEFSRRKTTQKVNLYEKVQIPGYREAIMKIRRFLDDEENLAKSAQKILKARLAQPESTGSAAS